MSTDLWESGGRLGATRYAGGVAYEGDRKWVQIDGYPFNDLTDDGGATVCLPWAEFCRMVVSVLGKTRIRVTVPPMADGKTEIVTNLVDRMYLTPELLTVFIRDGIPSE